MSARHLGSFSVLFTRYKPETEDYAEWSVNPAAARNLSRRRIRRAVDFFLLQPFARISRAKSKKGCTKDCIWPVAIP